MHFTLYIPGEDVSSSECGAINIDYAGGGVVLYTTGAGSPKPHYFDNAAEAKKWMIRSANWLLDIGYEVFTGEEVS